ncbi:glycosyltransferase involved in cell wall biosynthesis [Povalibacter uvarum]|uniref:Glycosyltransferase involved in cell wall biosynthesis n=1 Tax=Povalibacter uvarum TaxID=732238 RepID=A0A841HH87_9GAMM|nr:glycosyltransferase family 2 protein [Povalibacter uvarum]MBB6091648.1 glycosyltransferase involved in cell wall biosynthesis [Povalibacter uvarum]
MTALVSVIVAAYNAADLIGETLESIQSQSYSDIEIIVVDDGSGDSTREVVRRFDGVTLIESTNSGGPSVPRNIGARHARGDYLAFFDADDLMTTDHIRMLVEFLESHASAQLAICNYRNFTEQGPYPRTHFDTCTNLRRVLAKLDSNLLTGSQARDALLIENFGCTCASMFRRAAFEASGGFDAGLHVGEDYDLIYRVAGMGDVGVVPYVGFDRRLHGNNVSNRVEYNLRQKLRTRQKILAGEPDAARQRSLRHIIGRLHADLFQHLSRRSPREALMHLWHAASSGAGVVNIQTLKGLAKVAIGSSERLLRG